VRPVRSLSAPLPPPVLLSGEPVARTKISKGTTSRREKGARRLALSKIGPRSDPFFSPPRTNEPTLAAIPLTASPETALPVADGFGDEDDEKA
jgi:hypothetical protein